MSKNRLPEWATNYNTLVEGRMIQDLTRRIQILERPHRSAVSGRGIDPHALLHGGLLAVKVWAGTGYVWPGDGLAPDADAYTVIMFIDTDGTHDPDIHMGGRNSEHDIWITELG